MKIFAILAFAVFVVAGCKKEINAPACIKAKIEEIKNSPNAGIKAVREYVFKNMTVYIFESEPMPDGASFIYDQNCNELCMLGGIAGNLNCLGEHFGNNAVFVRTVWEK